MPLQQLLATLFLAVVSMYMLTVGILNTQRDAQQLQESVTEMVVRRYGPAAAPLVAVGFIALSYLLVRRKRTASKSVVPIPEHRTLLSDELPLDDQVALCVARVSLDGIARIVFGSPRYVLNQGFSKALETDAWVGRVAKDPLENWLCEVIGIEFKDGTMRIYRKLRLEYFRAGDLQRSSLPRVLEEAGISVDGDVMGKRTGADSVVRAAVIVATIIVLMLGSFLFTRYVLFPELFVDWNWNM